MKIVISQPMYLPWRGIFEQVRLCDHFVFYDDVQLPKGTHKTFITRVQIKTADGWAWLSVPVRRAGRSSQLISETLFDGQEWRRRHRLKIEEAYREAPFFAEVREELLDRIFDYETENFSDFCVFSTKRICEWLGLRPGFHLSSASGIPRDVGASRRVLDLCRRYGADVHVAGHGAKNYLDHDLFDRNGIETHYMEYRRTPYRQLHGEFNPHVTILDLLFNIGRDAPRYLDSEAVPWQTLPELIGGRETK